MICDTDFPHICLDATCIVPNGKGATVYAISLLRALQELNPVARFTVFLRQGMTDIVNFDQENWSVCEIKVTSIHLWHWFRLPGLLQKLKPDLLHILGEASLIWLPISYTLSVHELPHLYRKYTGYPTQTLYQRLSQLLTETLLPLTCGQAAHIMALSESTAEDLVKEFKLRRDCVSVAYPAASSVFFKAAELPVSDWCQSVPHPYLLTFATGDYREFPEQVVQAFGQIAAQIPHQLVIAGGCPKWQKDLLINQAVQYNCQGRLYFTGFVPDDDLPILYRDADVYLEMSRYEGFGLQVCEAMATGTVAIASDVASLPEVIGHGSYLVPLNNSAILAETLLLLLTNPTELKKVSQLAQQQSSQFSWYKCAQDTWKAIQLSLSC